MAGSGGQQFELAFGLMCLVARSAGFGSEIETLVSLDVVHGAEVVGSPAVEALKWCSSVGRRVTVNWPTLAGPRPGVPSGGIGQSARISSVNIACVFSSGGSYRLRPRRCADQ